MSLYDYEQSKKISVEDPPFYALIMAAMRQADTINSIKLLDAWPDTWKELRERYNAPGGAITFAERQQVGEQMMRQQEGSP